MSQSPAPIKDPLVDKETGVITRVWARFMDTLLRSGSPVLPIDGGTGVVNTGEVDATLSGTAKLFSIKDSTGTVYYFRAYPTKS